MNDNHQNATVFQCECGKRFTSEAGAREHSKTHEKNVLAASAHAGSHAMETTERGEVAQRTGNQQGREESQQGFRQPKGPSVSAVPEVKDEREWKHGKQSDDTQNTMTDDWGKSDKH